MNNFLPSLETLNVDKNARLIVVGLGVTGFSVARFLNKLGLNFKIVDSRDNPSALAEFQKQFPHIEIQTGKFEINAFIHASHLIVSPGVSLTENAIVEAVKQGVKILSDIDLFACCTNAPIIAITGANGKSTVTTMVGEMAKNCGKKVGVGGNLGTAALDLLNNENELYVLELSSFQLERTSLLNAKAATVLNISADHLDRHIDLDDYANQKQRIFNGNGIIVLNADDDKVSAMQMQNRQVLTFSVRQKADFHILSKNNVEFLAMGETNLMPLEELPLEGRHNAANALAALALGYSVGLNVDLMCDALKDFQGLAHRMQKVAEKNGITWVNDSKATNIGACIAALDGYDKKIILIAGGQAKGADMSELKPIIESKTKILVLIGQDAPLIANAVGNAVPVYFAEDMHEAVAISAHFASAGDTVLLSPACASLDQFKNYQDRGEQFTRAVMELPS